MTTESVGILIEADDQASAKLKKVGDVADAQVKRIKDVGGKAKASTEFVGTLSNALGGTQFGGFASGLAQLTERISNFAEVSKMGGAGALAFKAGLVAAAGVVTYQIAESIAGWWFEAERWRKEMEAGAKAARDAEVAFDRARSKKFSQDREDLSLIADPVDRERATNDRAAQLDKQAAEMQAQVDKARAEVLKQDDPQLLAASQAQLDVLTSMQRQFREEADALRDTVSERTKKVEAIKAENAEKEKSRSFLRGLEDEVYLLKANKEERIKLTAMMNVGMEDQGAAEALLREKEALLEKAEAQKKAEQEAEQARKKEAAEAERVADLQEREIERLEQRRIEIEQGKEAAKAYALQQQGLNSEEARNLAAKEAALDAQAEEQEKLKALAKVQPGVQATESRLLTRGPAETGIEKVAKISEKSNALLEGIKNAVEKRPQAMQLEVVG